MEKIIPYIKKRIREILSEGLCPKEMAMAVSVGMMISIIPILGVTTVILVFIAKKTKLNFPLLIGTSYTFTPIQLLLFVPFIKAGYLVFGHSQLTAIQFSELQKLSLYELTATLGIGIVYAFILWILIAIPLGLLLYVFFRYLFLNTPILAKINRQFKPS